MPPRRKRSGAAPGQVNAAQVEQASKQATASAAQSGKRFAVRVVGGWPRQVQTVFAVYRSALQAQDMAERLARSGAHASWGPAERTDYPGRTLQEYAE